MTATRQLIDVRPVAWSDPDAVALRAAMDREIAPRYADRESSLPVPAEMYVDPADVLYVGVAFIDGRAVGHVAVRALGPEYEIKKLIVTEAAREHGVGRALLAAAEAAVAHAGGRRVILQTGDRQPDAVALYQRADYTAIPIYPPYLGLPYSLCFEKEIGAGPSGRLRFHWFLPTGGDGRSLATGVHGLGIGATLSPATGAGRPASLSYLTQLAQAADALGYEAVLTPTGAHCADAWVVTAALIASTRRLKFLVAFRPGLTEPALAAQMAATFQQLSGGRLLLNVVTGGSSAEQRAYGDHLDHDARYRRAEEFLQVVRRLWSGEQFDHHGGFYDLEQALLREPPTPRPDVYFGGSSPAALSVAAVQADCYLTWGEPPELVAEKIDQVRELAATIGRSPRFGLRIHVITRDTATQAWTDANRLIDGLDDAAISAGQQRLRALESVGQQRILDLHGGSRDHLVVGPNLWAGVGLVRGGAGTALVGSHDEVAERISEYQAAGIDEFILSGYPHLEEAYAFAEGVRPLLV